MSSAVTSPDPRAGWTRSGRRLQDLRPRTQALLAGAGGVILGVLIWQLLSGGVLEFLPTPEAVWNALVDAVSSSAFYDDLAVTLQRILIATAIAFTAGVVLGILMARNWIVETLAHPWVFVALALPAPVGILFWILALGLGDLPGMVALVVIVTPYVVTLIYDSARALDPKLFDMAAVYNLSRGQRLREVIVPQLAPALLAAGRIGFAMAWKIVVLVEALSATNGLGQALRTFFSYNQPQDLIAWTLAFTGVMVLVELLFFQTVSRKLFAWRPKD